jgi:lipoate-protein ligase A
MIARRDRKVPGGKLLRAEVEVEAGVVLAASIRGDFFAHPEESFEAAEAELAGLPADRLGEAALSLFSKPPLRIIGATASDIAGLLVETAREAQAH